MSGEDLLGAALALSPEQRERLAEELLVSVAHDRGVDSATIDPDPELASELDRRVAMLDGGEAGTVSLEQAKARALRRLAEISGK